MQVTAIHKPLAHDVTLDKYIFVHYDDVVASAWYIELSFDISTYFFISEPSSEI